MSRPLLLALLLGGCLPSPYRLGVQAAAEGRLTAAVDHWLDAAEADLDDPRPARQLDAWLNDSWEFGLDEARELEADGLPDGALAAYDAILLRAERAEALGLHLDVEPAREERDAVRRQLSSRAMARGDEALAEGQLDTAESAWQSAIAFSPDTLDLGDRLGVLARLRAEDALRLHHYRESSESYHRAFELTGDQDMDAWAAAIDAALGRYALEQRACRQAVADLGRAHQLPNDDLLDADLATARRCARVMVSIEPFELDLQHEAATRVALPSLLVDQLEVLLRGEGSEWIRIFDEDLLGRAGANATPERRYRVRGRLTRITVETVEPSKIERTGEGRDRIPCPEEVQIYRGDDAVCTNPVPIAWQEHVTSRSVRLVGSVKVTDLATAEVITRPLDVTEERVVQWVDGFEAFRGEGRVPFVPRERPEEGVVAVDPALVALTRPATPLPSEDDLLLEAVRRLGRDAATEILAIADHEAPLEPPRRLRIAPPLLDPAELMFIQPALPEGPKLGAIQAPPSPEPTAPERTEETEAEETPPEPVTPEQGAEDGGPDESAPPEDPAP